MREPSAAIEQAVEDLILQHYSSFWLQADSLFAAAFAAGKKAGHEECLAKQQVLDLQEGLKGAHRHAVEASKAGSKDLVKQIQEMSVAKSPSAKALEPPTGNRVLTSGDEDQIRIAKLESKLSKLVARNEKNKEIISKYEQQFRSMTAGSSSIGGGGGAAAASN
eukprot:TRINITY_DN22957_c0_g1_i1.p2 TRINITY_DN22957_c0_g1~~TRINITY_DN22957_c0_g1_i1.p2  ORF type:complete len:164 (+),score=37.98 TRINITY_DN22957_c0_g1_i1:408-899(+)